MIIKAIVENTTISDEYKPKHGLCLYVEAQGHKMLFDLGPNALFLKNLEKMGINVEKIDTVVISHGHADHGGGLEAFLEKNTQARIYIRKSAFQPHFIKVAKIPIRVSLDPKLINTGRFIFTKDVDMIDNGLVLISGVRGRSFLSEANTKLFVRKHKQMVNDDFMHEQSLLITENERTALISGCSHAGIVNIQKKAEHVHGDGIDLVVGGFHLYNPPTGKYESDELIDGVADALSGYGSTYYTCHCTGEKAYDRMKEKMGDRLNYLATGDMIDTKKLAAWKKRD